MAKPERTPDALPSFKGVSISIGGFLAGLEQVILHRRPPAAIIVEEDARSQPRSVNGLHLEGADDMPQRPEPPDRSGARL